MKLGVLFVHGIGNQASGHTLVQWGDELLRVIAHATQGSVIPIVESAEPADPATGRSAEAVVRFERSKDDETASDIGDERWLLSEAWWADAFPPPTYGELVSWSLKAVPWALALHIAQRYWQAEGDQRAVIARGQAIVQLVGALILAPVVMLVLGLTLVLGLLPIPQLRSVILSAQSVLTGTMGDSLAFVESPLRAGLIRTPILTALERLRSRCDHTIIVAHSQGAAAALEALGGITGGTGTSSGRTAVPDTLLTFGAGINQLVSLKVLSSGLPRTVSGNPVYLGVGALAGTLVMLGWLGRALRQGLTTWTDIGHSFAVVVAAVALVAAAVAAIRRWNGTLSTKAARWSLTVAMLAVVGGAMGYSEVYQLPLGTVNLVLLAVLMSWASLQLILSSDIRQAVTSPVQKPKGVESWVDIFASADPVPNGPTRIDDANSLESIRIWNRGSLFSDHTSYWQNRDGFVLRVARVCARTAGSWWQFSLPHGSSSADSRAQWRVGLVRLAVWITRAAWLTILVVLWRRWGLAIPAPVEVPAWIPFSGTTAFRWTWAPVGIGAAAWLTTKLLYLLWGIWTHQEQAMTLDHRPFPASLPVSMYASGVVVGFVVWLLILIAEDVETAAGLLSRLREGSVPVLAGLGLIFALLAWRLRPPPN